MPNPFTTNVDSRTITLLREAGSIWLVEELGKKFYGDLFLTHESLTISVRNPSFSTNAVDILVLYTLINRVVQEDMSKLPDDGILFGSSFESHMNH